MAAHQRNLTENAKTMRKSILAVKNNVIDSDLMHKLTLNELKLHQYKKMLQDKDSTSFQRKQMKGDSTPNMAARHKLQTFAEDAVNDFTIDEL